MKTYICSGRDKSCERCHPLCPHGKPHDLCGGYNCQSATCSHSEGIRHVICVEYVDISVLPKELFEI